MHYNPAHPHWLNRDRFVLSAGHGSALLYSMLYLTGYDLGMEDLQTFRQWGSRTPGHPEYGLTPGVETTTGPLGQGFANAVGMAMAERYLADHYNRPGLNLIDYHVYGICSDGDLMEGVASEAASIAGHLRLGKLIFFYDDNHVSIEGTTNLAFTESVKNRFEAYGWQVIEIDGNDVQAVTSALHLGQAEKTKPTLIKAKTHIGYGSPHKQDTAAAHGEPLGEEELKAAKAFFGFPQDKTFYIPDEVKDFFGQLRSKGQDLELEWQASWAQYQKQFPEPAEELKALLGHGLKPEWDKFLPVFTPEAPLATRKASGTVLNAMIKQIPLLIGGSADLAPSTGTQLKGYCEFNSDHYGCPNFHFGVREHAMGAIVNGMALSGLLRPYGATFLIFSDYMRPAIRLAALMDIPSTFIFTHDSIGLGEDGPTHQPVEQLMALRAIPNLTVFRPADANETTVAWQLIMERRKPAALVLTRQNLTVLDTTVYPIKDKAHLGGYVLAEKGSKSEILLLATGSEVSLALEVQKILAEAGLGSRVVSMLSWEVLAEQPQAYQDSILKGPFQLKVAIEAGATLGWANYVGQDGLIVGLDRFGASAPGARVMKEYGFDAPVIVAKIKERLQP
jgi:transketolase